MTNFNDLLIAEPFRKQSEEVFFSRASIVAVGKAQISSLKESAHTNPRRRVRLCTHMGITDPLHEMMIIHSKDTYVRPHKHLNKSESFHVIEGFADVVLFDEAGEILNVISMGDYPSGKTFYYRLSEPFYHTLLIRSQVLIFHEITNGPFKREETLFAPWAPQENETSRIMEFLDQLNCRIEQLFLSQPEGDSSHRESLGWEETQGLPKEHPPAPTECVKKFLGQRGRSSALDRPPFSKGGLERGKRR